MPQLYRMCCIMNKPLGFMTASLTQTSLPHPSSSILEPSRGHQDSGGADKTDAWLSNVFRVQHKLQFPRQQYKPAESGTGHTHHHHQCICLYCAHVSDVQEEVYGLRGAVCENISTKRSDNKHTNTNTWGGSIDVCIFMYQHVFRKVPSLPVCLHSFAR
jgi:hypothetical protein